MDAEKRVQMLTELDIAFDAAVKIDPKVKVQDVVKANLDNLSKKFDMDPIDIFVEYMDHIAESSEKIGKANEEGQQIDIDFNNLDNIKLS